MMQAKEWNIGAKLLLIAVVPLIGTGIMFALTHAFNLEAGSAVGATVYTLSLVFLGLAIPYVMLKTLFSAAHTQNPIDEKEIHLEDIPDDKDQLGRKLDSQF